MLLLGSPGYLSDVESVHLADADVLDVNQNKPKSDSSLTPVNSGIQEPSASTSNDSTIKASLELTGTGVPEGLNEEVLVQDMDLLLLLGNEKPVDDFYKGQCLIFIFSNLVS